jgi:hypothetical protein
MRATAAIMPLSKAESGFYNIPIDENVGHIALHVNNLPMKSLSSKATMYSGGMT